MGCDNGESTSTARKIGWFIPRRDGKVDLGTGPRLSAENWAEFKSMIEVMAEIRPFLVDYLSLENDFMALAGMENEIVTYLRDMPNPVAFGGVQQTIVLAKAQGALSNFLSSTSAFRDRSDTRLRERYGKHSNQHQQLLGSFKAAYDRSFAYRLLYNVRNYGQHHDSPLSMIPTHGARLASGELDFTVSLVLAPKEMLRSEKIQKSFRSELSARPGELHLIPLVKEFFYLHGGIIKVVIDMYMPRLIQFQNYGRAVLTRMRVPEGAVPVIFEGEDLGPHVMFPFSFDEFAFVHDLHQRLGNPALFAAPSTM